MSNYHSIIRNYGEPQSNFNAELAIKALSYKQDRYDSNAAKIQETLANYGNIDFARPEDRDNFYNKINNHIQNIEGLKGADLSNSSITSSITAHISKALDQDTLKQVGQTQQIRQFQQGLSELQKKNPDAITQTNYQDALIQAGYDKYMSEESDDLRNLNYTPFVDPTEDILGRIKKLKDVMGKQVIELPDRNSPTGFSEVTTDNMTVAQWMQYMPQLITQQNRDQFAINGRTAFGHSDEEAVKALDIAKETNLAPEKERLKKNQTILDDPTADEHSKEQAEKAIEASNNRILEINDYYARIPKNATAIGSYMEEQNLVENLARMIGSDPSIKFTQEKAYLARLKEQQAAAATNALGINRFTATELGADTTGSINLQKTHQEAKVEAQQQWKGRVNTLYDSFDDTTKKLIQDAQSVIKTNNPTFSDTEALHEAVLKHTTNPEVRTELMRMKDTQDRFIQAEAKALKKTSQDIFNSNYKEIYEAVAIEKHKMTIGRVPVKEYLISKGVNDSEDFLAFINSEKGTEFRAAISTNFLLSNMQDTLGGGINNIGKALTTDGKIGRLSNEDLFFFNQTAEILGETGLKFTDVFDIEDASFITNRLLPFGQSEVRDGESGMWRRSGVKLKEEDFLENIGDFQEVVFISLKEGAENNKVGQAIIKTLENREFSRPTPFNIQIGRDRTFYDDKTIRNTMSFSENRKRYEENLNANSVAIQGRNMVTVTLPGTQKEAQADPVYKEFESLMSLPTAQGGRFEINLSQPVRVTENLATGNVVISQFQSFASAKILDSTGIPQTGQDNKIEVSREDFNRLAPNVASQVELSQADQRIKFDRDKTVTSPYMSFIPTNNEQKMREHAMFVGEPNLAPYISKEGTISQIKNTLPEMYLPQANAKYRTAFDKALQNPNQFRAEMVSQGQYSYVSIKALGEEVYQIPTSDFDSTQIERLIYGTPQVFLGMALDFIATDLKNEQLDSFNKLQKVLEKI